MAQTPADYILHDDYPFPNVKESENHLVKGCPPTPEGHPGIRQEIRDLQQDTELWNLFLLGMYHWMRVPQDLHYSWFRIAGIHGYPYQKWPPNDPLLDSMKAASGDAAFCTHTSILFLSWHRPYLALYEEVFYRLVEIIANKFTDAEGKAKWVKAAKRFRVPYWDWARQDRPTFPEAVLFGGNVVVTMPKVMADQYKLKQYEDGQTEIHNPLFQYTWQTGTADGYLINKRGTTVRYEKAADDGKPPSDDPSPDEVQARLEAQLKPYDSGKLSADGDLSTQQKVEGNLTERIVYLLQAYDKYFMFTSNKYDRPDQSATSQGGKKFTSVRGAGFGSLEDIHNSMHDLAGGVGGGYTGHMAKVELSAFDPIFWLHHANVGRVAAIWQALHDDPSNPDSYVIRTKSDTGVFGGTWVTAKDDWEDINTPLAPFYQSPGKFYTSEGVRHTSSLGYVYPETQEWKYKGDKAAYRGSIAMEIGRLYSTGSLATMIARRRITGSHDDEDRLVAAAKKWKRIQQAPGGATALTMLQINKAITQSTGSWSAGTTATAPQGTIQGQASGSWGVPSGGILGQAASAVGQGVGAVVGAGAQVLGQATGAWHSSIDNMLGALQPIAVPETPEIESGGHRHRSLTQLAEDETYDEWMFNIISQKHALGGRYTVHVFLGPVDETNTHLFSVSPNHVGTFSPLGQPDTTGCAKCQADQGQDARITGQIPLTIALVERFFAGDINNIDSDQVIPYLQKNLHWEVLDSNGNRLPSGRDAVTGLKVAISSNEVKVPDTLQDLPEYSPDVRFWPEATTNQQGVGRAEGTGATNADIKLFGTIIG